MLAVLDVTEFVGERDVVRERASSTPDLRIGDPLLLHLAASRSSSIDQRIPRVS